MVRSNERCVVSVMHRAPFGQDRNVFENPKMPRKIAGQAVANDRSKETEPAPKRVYAPPRLRQLQSGTSEHDRAKAVFDLLRANKDAQG